MAAQYQSGSIREVEPLWHDASAQIKDGNKIIILNVDILNNLDAGGKCLFIYRCSLLLGKPADFFRDGDIPGTVYLGNANDLQRKYKAVTTRDPSDESGVLYRRTPQGRRIRQHH